MKAYLHSSIFLWSVFTTVLVHAESPDELRREAILLFGVIQAATEEELSNPKVSLGRSLFWDERLSASGKVACASCHLTEAWGADRRPHSVDARGKYTARHSQTVFNAMLQPTLRWTGDRKSGQHQAEKSLTGSMGFALAEDVVPLLIKFGYEEDFRRIWPEDREAISPAHYAQAIQSYESTLNTPAAFDRFLNADDTALSAVQLKGLSLFMKTGCSDCHDGPLLGGRSLEKFGVKTPYPPETGSKQPDAGLFEITRKDEDRDRFRVSMLRNIAKTSPYFHDGSVVQLEQAIQVMAKVQMGNRFTEAELTAMIAFLESLSGEVPSNYSVPNSKPDAK